MHTIPRLDSNGEKHACPAIEPDMHLLDASPDSRTTLAGLLVSLRPGDATAGTFEATGTARSGSDLRNASATKPQRRHSHSQ